VQAPFLDSLRIPLLEAADDSELELRVQVLQGGQVIGEASMKKPAPVKGGASRLSLVLKRG